MKISVIIPCFNESGNIEAMYSRVSQTLTGLKFETIFVDDGSLDSTFLEIENLQSRFPESVKFVKHEANSGVYKAWKSGFELAKYPLICLIN